MALNDILRQRSVSSFFHGLTPAHRPCIIQAIAKSTWSHSVPPPDNLAEKMQQTYHGTVATSESLRSLRGPFGGHNHGTLSISVTGERFWHGNDAPLPTIITGEGELSRILFPGAMLYFRDQVLPVLLNKQGDEAHSSDERLLFHLDRFKTGIGVFFRDVHDLADRSSIIYDVHTKRYGQRACPTTDCSQDYFAPSRDEVMAAVRTIDSQRLGPLDLRGEALIGIDLGGMSIVGGDVDHTNLTDAILAGAAIVCRNLGSAILPKDTGGAILSEFMPLHEATRPQM